MVSRAAHAAWLCLLAGALAGCASREPCGRVWQGRGGEAQKEDLRAIGRDALSLATLDALYQQDGRITRVNGREVYDETSLARLARLNRYSETRRTSEGVDFRYHPSDTIGTFYTFPDVLFPQLGLARSATEPLALRMDEAGIILLERQPGAVLMICSGALDGSYGVLYAPGDPAADDERVPRGYRDRPVGRDLYAWGHP